MRCVLLLALLVGCVEPEYVEVWPPSGVGFATTGYTGIIECDDADVVAVRPGRVECAWWCATWDEQIGAGERAWIVRFVEEDSWQPEVEMDDPRCELVD